MNHTTKESMKKYIKENGIVPRGSWFAAMESNLGWKHIEVCGQSFCQSKKEMLDLVKSAERICLDCGMVWHEIHVLKA